MFLRYKNYILFGVGSLIGTINGAFGGGGGLVAVPALQTFSSLSVEESHATAILVILPVTFVSALTYLYLGAVDLFVLVPCSLGVSVGGLLGAKLLKKCSGVALTFLFAAIMLFAGIKSLI